ncbi:MAG: tetrahydromethanopterin S-methyltransferase subunit H [Candidatus Thorarchaeota archaeon]|nr:MAG: tetrahydromethanopterin S-methyltransferase subunit H [Candidatus Thorarchaeota archaeon]
MYEYKSQQRTLEFGGVKIGGTPGLAPTVLIGSIFYSKDKLVLDPKAGDIDKPQTDRVLTEVADMSERTGLPSMLDVVASSSPAMRRYITYLADKTSMPLLIDGSGSQDVNLAGIEMARENGMLDRVMLNSLTPETSNEMYRKMQEAGLKSAVILTFSKDAMSSVAKRTELADQILAKATDSGLTNLIIDTGVVDMLTLGLACKAMQSIKDKLGYPVGCGAHNAVNMWAGLVPKFGKDAKNPALVGSSLMPVVLGADFVLYGPVKHAGIVFPSVAMIDTALSGVLLEKRIRPDRQHPRFRIG